MNWITLLSQAYNKFYPKFGTVDEIKKAIENGKRPLLPLDHKEQLSQLEITLDKNANVINITTVDKNNQPTIIPCTIKSANKTSGLIAHPLTDNLEYLAGDLTNWLTEEDKKIFAKSKDDDSEKEEISETNEEENEVKKKKEKSEKTLKFNEKNALYLSQLKLWSESKFATEKVKIIYQYLSKKNLIADLVKFRIVANIKDKIVINYNNIENKEDYKLYKLASASITKSFVRFRVDNSDETKECWLDNDMFKSWQDFYSTIINGEKDFCYATLNQQFLTEMHDKQILSTGSSGKLISGNDSNGFTYRGRFSTPNEAGVISKETSAKMHNALKWLISRQAFRNGDYCFLVWSDEYLEAINPLNNKFDKDLIFEDDFEKVPDFETGDLYAQNLTKLLGGYKNLKEVRGNFIMLGLSLTTPGRVSVIYFNYLSAPDYLYRVKKWYESVNWIYNFYSDEKKNIKVTKVIRTPVPKEIARTIYGERNLKEKVLSKFYERLNYCILNQSKLPYDFIKSAVAKVGLKVSFVDMNNKFSDYMWQNALATTCALIKKYYKKENYKMELENDRKTRSYVFGRLLAVGDYVEQLALWKNKIDRITTATRVFNNFALNPSMTWQYIRENLNNYFGKLDNNGHYFKFLIDDITSMLSTEQFNSNQPLEPEYLIGYSHQMMKLKEKKDKEKNSNEEGENKND